MVVTVVAGVTAVSGGGGGGSGTVTNVSVATASGVSGSVANSSTTPAITITLGNILPNSVNAGSGEVAYLIGGVNALSFPSEDTTAGASIAIGGAAMNALPASAAYGNIAIGYQSMSGALTASAINNTIIGWQAGTVMTSGSANTGVGWKALQALTNGNQNTAIGWAAGLNLTSGVGNVAVGRLALGNSTLLTGNNNVAVGTGALALATGACAGNTAVGASAGVAVTSGTNNVMIGINSGNKITTGLNNVVIGNAVASATSGLTTGNRNILIGTSSAVDTPNTGSSDRLNIANLLLGSTSGTLKFLQISGGAIMGMTTFTGSGNYTLLQNDYCLAVNKTTGAATTILMLASPETGRQYVIKDAKFDAGTNNITLSGNGVNIENSSNYILSTSGASATVIYSGTQWLVI